MRPMGGPCARECGPDPDSRLHRDPTACARWGRVLFPALNKEHSSPEHLDVRSRCDAKRKIDEAAGSQCVGSATAKARQVAEQLRLLEVGSPLLIRYAGRPRCGLSRDLALSPTHSWIILGPRIHRWRAHVFSLTLPATDASRCSQTSRFPWPCESTTDGVAHRFDPDPIRQPTPETDAANPSARHQPGLS